MHNFDIEVSRRGTYSAKWKYCEQPVELKRENGIPPRNGRVLPLWVADMDFQCAQPIIDAVKARAAHGIYGYTLAGDDYFSAVLRWTERRYGWPIEREWIKFTPGIVSALNMLVTTFTKPEEKVLIQRPVYHPFHYAIENKGRELVSNSLIYTNGRYTMDFDDLRAKTADPDLKLAILCNPHNPVGRVWTPEELTQFGEICLDNEVLIISDEIHCDLLYSGVEFKPFASLSERFLQNSVTCMSPSKSFNLAGLKHSNIIVPNESLREGFAKTLDQMGMYGINCFAAVATIAAYNEGEPWLAAVREYIESNFEFMRDYLAKHVPQMRPVQPEGTYLVWVDCHPLELSAEERKKLFFDQSGVYLSEGSLFGPEGEMFERINIACPRPILAEALERICNAVNARERIGG